ncbi:Uncharacterized protein Adt_27587 [Abeliophyllum distichum]|uniref:Uncharacterized protein n=1 Tax=Abeliophyllum distichum TaxID=126358 RepID=A0ABD1RU59_9LAMI
MSPVGNQRTQRPTHFSSPFLSLFLSRCVVWRFNIALSSPTIPFVGANPFRSKKVSCFHCTQPITFSARFSLTLRRDLCALNRDWVHYSHAAFESIYPFNRAIAAVLRFQSSIPAPIAAVLPISELLCCDF